MRLEAAHLSPSLILFIIAHSQTVEWRIMDLGVSLNISILLISQPSFPLASRFFPALSVDFAYSKKKRPKDINIRSASRNDPVTLSWWLGSLGASIGFWMFLFHWNFSLLSLCCCYTLWTLFFHGFLFFLYLFENTNNNFPQVFIFQIFCFFFWSHLSY